MAMEGRRLTPFMVFYCEQRDQVDPSLSPAETSRALLHKWQNLSSDAVKEYCLISGAYTKAAQLHGDVLTGKRKREKKERGPTARNSKDPREPKQPVSAFIFFSRHHRGTLKKDSSNLSQTDITKTLQAMWKAASPVERLPFENMSLQDRHRYDKQLQEHHLRLQQEQAAAAAAVAPLPVFLPPTPAAQEMQQQAVQHMAARPLAAADPVAAMAAPVEAAAAVPPPPPPVQMHAQNMPAPVPSAGYPGCAAGAGAPGVAAPCAEATGAEQVQPTRLEV